MKKITILLSLVLVFTMAILSGCGSSTSSSDKFIGTWELKENETYYLVSTIEKKSDTTYYLTQYVINQKTGNLTQSHKELTPDEKDKNVLKMSGGSRVIINNEGKLEILKDKSIFTKKSDKILDINEVSPVPLRNK
ncbi:hypothetical protein [Veillonella seminalis]|uniref:Lipocalin-like domain-containing protein n=1 Tax=Veillonella seminalis ACS-216-V-Col6b TaxID=883156 RepID=K9DIZ3_9FIRM|nr:hypothetical protein [Veillonella seminalis]EKU77370.1 hypothetical protein HMPREF9282_02087 [Veillonella seminalis ACS-216-V-Col6b]